MVLDFKDREGNWVASYKCGDRRTKHTKIGQLHADMTKRCTEGSPEQTRHKHYVGCCMSDDFKDRNLFGDWAVEQIGYGRIGWQLDKDILVKDNKLYSKTTCVFVPNALNKFLTKRQSCRGQYPLGVRKRSYKSTYEVSLTLRSKSVYAGSYNTVEEAFSAYKSAKETESKFLANFYKADVDPRVYQALMNYEVLITD